MSCFLCQCLVNHLSKIQKAAEKRVSSWSAAGRSERLVLNLQQRLLPANPAVDKGRERLSRKCPYLPADLCWEISSGIALSQCTVQARKLLCRATESCFTVCYVLLSGPPYGHPWHLYILISYLGLLTYGKVAQGGIGCVVLYVLLARAAIISPLPDIHGLGIP